MIRVSIEKLKGLKAYWTLEVVSNLYLQFKIQLLHTNIRKTLIRTEYLRNWGTENNCNYNYSLKTQLT